MRRAIVIAVSLSCLGVEVGVAKAVWEAYTGQRLQQACEDKIPFCGGYVLGIVDARYDEGTFCLPGEVSTNRIVDVVTRFLQKHPAYGHVDASVLVVDALKEEFPCS